MAQRYVLATSRFPDDSQRLLHRMKAFVQREICFQLDEFEESDLDGQVSHVSWLLELISDYRYRDPRAAREPGGVASEDGIG